MLVDARQETGVPGVFCAGEACGVAGVEAALAEGQIAGAAAAVAAGRPEEEIWDLRRLDAHAGRGAHLREPDAARVPPPPGARAPRSGGHARLPLRGRGAGFACAACAGAREAKLAARAGMGPCQGRVCGPALAFLFGWESDTVRTPIQPAALGALGLAGPGSEEEVLE